MKLSYIMQMRNFCLMLIIGFIISTLIGILYGFIKIKSNQIIKIIANIIFTSIITLTFLFSINIINLGEIRAYLLLGYTVGIILEKITFGKIFAKGYKYVYNKLVVIVTKFKNGRIGKVIFK